MSDIDLPAGIKGCRADAETMLSWLDDWMDQREFRHRVNAHAKSRRDGGQFFCGGGYGYDDYVLYQYGLHDRALMVLHEMMKAGLVQMEGAGGRESRYRRAHILGANGHKMPPTVHHTEHYNDSSGLAGVK